MDNNHNLSNEKAARLPSSILMFFHYRVPKGTFHSYSRKNFVLKSESQPAVFKGLNTVNISKKGFGIGYGLKRVILQEKSNTSYTKNDAKKSKKQWK